MNADFFSFLFYLEPPNACNTQVGSR